MYVTIPVYITSKRPSHIIDLFVWISEFKSCVSWRNSLKRKNLLKNIDFACEPLRLDYTEIDALILIFHALSIGLEVSRWVRAPAGTKNRKKKK